MLLAVVMAEVTGAGADTVTGASLEQAAERDARVAALVVILADARDACCRHKSLLAPPIGVWPL